MAERFSWATTESGGDVGVEDARIALSAVLTPGPALDTTAAGMLPGTGDPYRVHATTPTASGNVTVAGGHMAMRASRGTGSYMQTLSPVAGFGKTINVLSTPADPTNNRHDLIVAQQSDKFYGDSANQYLVKQIVGTPSGTPVDPAVTGSPDYFTLARVNVRAGATSILETDITDLRPGWVVALGGILPVATQSVRDALPTPIYEGYAIYRMDRNWVEINDGTAWRVQGTAVCSSTSDMSAITSPYVGQRAVTTDSFTFWIYTGSGWVAEPTLGLGGLLTGLATSNVTVNNSTTLVDIPGMSMTLAPFATYALDGWIYYTTGSTPGLKLGLVLPSGAGGNWSDGGSALANGNRIGTIDTGVLPVSGTFAVSGDPISPPVGPSARIAGQIGTGASGGTCKLQVAQQVANASNTVLQSGSWMRLHRIS